MKLFMRFIACVCIAFCLAGISYAKEWRGIVPFQSTRADVEKLLGEPPPPPRDGTISYKLIKERSFYFLDEGEVYIRYAEDDFTKDCLDAVPADTVLVITITRTRKKELKLADLKLNLTKFKKFDPAEPKGIGYEGYFDEDEGLLIRVYKGIVDEITYLPTASERPKCKYYENPESFIYIMFCGLSAS